MVQYTLLQDSGPPFPQDMDSSINQDFYNIHMETKDAGNEMVFWSQVIAQLFWAVPHPKEGLIYQPSLAPSNLNSCSAGMRCLIKTES